MDVCDGEEDKKREIDRAPSRVKEDTNILAIPKHHTTTTENTPINHTNVIPNQTHLNITTTPPIPTSNIITPNTHKILKPPEEKYGPPDLSKLPYTPTSILIDMVNDALESNQFPAYKPTSILTNYLTPTHTVFLDKLLAKTKTEPPSPKQPNTEKWTRREPNTNRIHMKKLATRVKRKEDYMELDSDAEAVWKKTRNTEAKQTITTAADAEQPRQML